MILKLSQKMNRNGWCRQLEIDFDNKTIKKGSFLFMSADIKGLTATQFEQVINYFKSMNFLIMEA